MLFVFVCLLLLPVGICSAADYRITESDLTRLEQIFNQLSSNNQALLSDLAASKQDLTTAHQRLATYQQELQLLQNQLLALKEESTKARSELSQANVLLKMANESLDKYEAEVRSEIRSLTWQRNGLILVAGLMAIR
mgnify:CR=1 FL=1